MKAKLIKCSNPAMEEVLGRSGNLSLGLTVHFDFREDSEGVSFDFRRGELSTSIVRSIDIDEVSSGCYEITITTRNSIYVFQVGELSSKKPMTNEEILDAQLRMGMHLF